MCQVCAPLTDGRPVQYKAELCTAAEGLVGKGDTKLKRRSSGIGHHAQMRQQEMLVKKCAHLLMQPAFGSGRGVMHA